MAIAWHHFPATPSFNLITRDIKALNLDKFWMDRFVSHHAHSNFFQSLADTMTTSRFYAYSRKCPSLWSPCHNTSTKRFAFQSLTQCYRHTLSWSTKPYTHKSSYLYHTSSSYQSLPSYYDLLQIPINATSMEIRSAFRRSNENELFKRAKACHPDLNSHDPQASRKFIQMKEAYETLINAEKRRKYDFQLMAQREVGQSRSSFSTASSYASSSQSKHQQRSHSSSQQYSYVNYSNSWRSNPHFSGYANGDWERDLDQVLRENLRREKDRKRIEPYFNGLLIASLLILGGIALWFQLESRYFITDQGDYEQADTQYYRQESNNQPTPLSPLNRFASTKSITHPGYGRENVEPSSLLTVRPKYMPPSRLGTPHNLHEREVIARSDVINGEVNHQVGDTIEDEVDYHQQTVPIVVKGIRRSSASTY